MTIGVTSMTVEAGASLGALRPSAAERLFGRAIGARARLWPLIAAFLFHLVFFIGLPFIPDANPPPASPEASAFDVDILDKKPAEPGQQAITNRPQPAPADTSLPAEAPAPQALAAPAAPSPDKDVFPAGADQTPKKEADAIATQQTDRAASQTTPPDQPAKPEDPPPPAPEKRVQEKPVEEKPVEETSAPAKPIEEAALPAPPPPLPQVETPQPIPPPPVLKKRAPDNEVDDAPPPKVKPKPHKAAPKKVETKPQHAAPAPPSAENTYRSASVPAPQPSPEPPARGLNAGLPPIGYIQQVAAFINRVKSYPEKARAAGQQGTAVVRFTIARSGAVGSVNLVRSSGSEALDEAGLALVRRAAPFPPLPSDFEGSLMTLTLPLSFGLR